MKDIRLPKRMMFGEVQATRPRHGPRSGDATSSWRTWIALPLQCLRTSGTPLLKTVQHGEKLRTAMLCPVLWMVLNSVAAAGRSAVARAISSAIHPFAELRQDCPFAIIAFGNGHVLVHVYVCVCVVWARRLAFFELGKNVALVASNIPAPYGVDQNRVVAAHFDSLANCVVERYCCLHTHTRRRRRVFGNLRNL